MTDGAGTERATTAQFACPCCGAREYVLVDVLWPALVAEWGLSEEEAAYTDRQQGLTCRSCRNTLRSMTLARAMMDCLGGGDTFDAFLAQHGDIRLLEVNEAGTLSPMLASRPNHVLASYPAVDLTRLPYADDSFDLVVHSDTLEHVDDPVAGLAETLRVLKPGGFTCFTVPVVVARLTKTRPASSPSYHGSEGNDEYLVRTEYGSDMWTQVLRAGFTECRLTSLEFPSSIAITGRKSPIRR